jgi:hypothetical protein
MSSAVLMLGVCQTFARALAWAMVALVALFFRRQRCSADGFRRTAGSVGSVIGTAGMGTSAGQDGSTSAALFGCTGR